MSCDLLCPPFTPLAVVFTNDDTKKNTAKQPATNSSNGQISDARHMAHMLGADFCGQVGSIRTEVVRFVGCGGLATFLAPGRGTYGLVRSDAFQGCKDCRKILKRWHMRAFSGSVLEWCGRADAARLLPQQPPSGRAAAGRTQAAAALAANKHDVAPKG